MTKVVPDTYTVEFGERVRSSFIQLGEFANKTEFRLEHLEKHLGEAFGEIEKLKKAKRGGKKRYLVLLAAGAYLGVKLSKRENQAKLRQVYSDLADKIDQAVSDAQNKTEEVKGEVKEKGQYVDEVLRGTPNPEGRLSDATVNR